MSSVADELHVATASVDEATARPDKRFATAKARAALAGATLYRVEDDRGDALFIINKWSLTRQLPDIEAVEAWLSRLPAP